MLAQQRLLRQLLCVISLDVLDFIWVGQSCVVDDRLHIVLQLLHDVFVLQLRDVAVFALHVGVEQRALLGRVTVLESLVPSQPLEL